MNPNLHVNMQQSKNFFFFLCFVWGGGGGVANQKKNNHLINCIVKQFCDGCKKEEIINHLSISHHFQIPARVEVK